jgi:hypothetical protein
MRLITILVTAAPKPIPVRLRITKPGGRVGVRLLGSRSPAGHRPFEFAIALPASFAVAA